MKKTISILFMAIGIAATVFTGCKKDDPTLPSQETKQHTTSRATAYGNDWIYFSFSSGSEVSGITEENRMNRLDWDIAFNRNNMRTNSGLSGKGKGGALDTGSKSFNDITQAPTNGYSVDEKAMIMFGLGNMMSGGQPEMGESTLNKVLKSAIGIDTSNPPPTYPLSEHVYIVKTADGKCVKAQFVSYHNDKGKSGFVTLKYTFIETI